MSAAPAELLGELTARHRAANALHTYVEVADRKDLDAAVAMLGAARVRFPADASSDPENARRLFARLWSSPAGHRHDVSNLVVRRGEEPGTWVGRAHYTRWVLDPDPVLHTLGEYTLVLDATWGIRALTVTRTWVATP